MDEQTQFRNLLQAAEPVLPASVVATCERLNEHGEWELALSHCQFHLAALGGRVPDGVRVLAAACATRFQPSPGA